MFDDCRQMYCLHCWILLVNLGWAHFCKTRTGLKPRFECVIFKKSCKTAVLMCCVVVLVQRKQLLSGTPRKYSLPARRSWTPSPLQVQNETWTIRDIRQENDGHLWKLYWSFACGNYHSAVLWKDLISESRLGTSVSDSNEMWWDMMSAWPAWPAWPRLGLGGSFAYRPGNLSLAWGGGRGADPWTNSWTKSDTAGYCIRSIDCYSRLWRSESLCHPQIL